MYALRDGPVPSGRIGLFRKPGEFALETKCEFHVSLEQRFSQLSQYVETLINH